MGMIADGPLDLCRPYGSHIYIPAVNRVTFGLVGKQALLVGATIYDLQFGKSYPLLIAGCRWYPRHHHKLDKFLRLDRQFPALGFLQSVFRGRDVLVREEFKELS